MKPQVIVCTRGKGPLSKKDEKILIAMAKQLIDEVRKETKKKCTRKQT